MDPAAAPLELGRISQDTFVDRVHFFDEVDSTNNAALAHAQSANEPLTELFVAETQTGGRGRGSNQWWSGPGALTWTLLTKPLDTPVAQLPQVSLTMGLAMCEVVEQFVAGDVTLKWPNDVFLDGRKTAGILIELVGDAAKRLVIGVGLNVNNSIQNAPEELRTTANSMRDAAGPAAADFDRSAVLVACMQQLQRHLQRFECQDPTLPDDWRKRSLLTGRQIRLETPRTVLTGQCTGVADDGALVLRTADGEETYYGGVVIEFN